MTLAPPVSAVLVSLPDRHLSESDDAAKDDLIWLAVVGCCNGGNEGGFTRRTASVFAGALATDVGVVHLHVAIETLGAVALDHDLSELVFHRPGGRLRDAEPAPQLDAGDALLGLRDEIDRFEPEAQRQLAGGEYRPGLDRGLLAAGVALEQPPRAALDDAMTMTSALRTFETVGPTPAHQRRVTLLFAPVQFVESGSLRPFWNWTMLRAISAMPLQIIMFRICSKRKLKLTQPRNHVQF